MPVYNTPDVYVEEISTLPPSIAEVSTAIPAFIGYTEYDDLSFTPTRITSFLEFTTLFGGAAPVRFSVTSADNVPTISITGGDIMQSHKLYYLLDLYFKNGGSDCYIVSLGAYSQKTKDDFSKGIDTLRTEDEPTLLILSEATTLDSNDYYALCQQALKQCADLQDRFCIIDVLPPLLDINNKLQDRVQDFRNTIGMNNLNYGAAYYPYLNTSINYSYAENNVVITPTDQISRTSDENAKNATGLSFISIQAPTVSYKPRVSIVISKDAKEVNFTSSFTSPPNPGELNIIVPGGSTAQDVINAWSNADSTLKANFNMSLINGSKKIDSSNSFDITTTSLYGIKQLQPTLYNAVKQGLSTFKLILPPAAAIAGIYAQTDRTRGVWKAPANVSLNSVIGPSLKISSSAQELLNVDATGGKSINAIRSFTGKGTLVWGARTLDGSSNEWRYVPVRRLFIMIEESAKKASYFAVFEPNSSATWLKVKGMVESFLYGIWQQGALAGATSKDAYYVNVGLNTTMTAQDVLEGRMIVEIGVAAVRPAEFIVLRFSHKLQEA